ncbi:hypothetical protein QJQ45_018878 [Haematococcus lacustris]|nr:hypothetical protein QJQ45_018878 [Haematococcus lacustris]
MNFASRLALAVALVLGIALSIRAQTVNSPSQCLSTFNSIGQNNFLIQLLPCQAQPPTQACCDRRGSSSLNSVPLSSVDNLVAAQCVIVPPRCALRLQLQSIAGFRPGASLAGCLCNAELVSTLNQQLASNSLARSAGVTADVIEKTLLNSCFMFIKRAASERASSVFMYGSLSMYGTPAYMIHPVHYAPFNLSRSQLRENLPLVIKTMPRLNHVVSIYVLHIPG